MKRRTSWSLDIVLRNQLSASFEISSKDKRILERELAEGSYQPDFVMFDAFGQYRVALNQSAAAIVRFRGSRAKPAPVQTIIDGISGDVVRVWTTDRTTPFDLEVVAPRIKVSADGKGVDTYDISHMLRLTAVCHGESKNAADVMKSIDGDYILPQCNPPSILTARGKGGDVAYLNAEMIAMLIGVI